MKKFSHLDEQGRARMVDVGHKPVQVRIAVAEGFVRCQAKTLRALKNRTVPKGDVFTVATIAGVQAAKRTDELIPLCHSLPLDAVDIRFRCRKEGVQITAEARTSARTGVEMEALTAVTVAALAFYDMCKAVDHQLVIEQVRLVSKVKQ